MNMRMYWGMRNTEMLCAARSRIDLGQENLVEGEVLDTTTIIARTGLVTYLSRRRG